MRPADHNKLLALEPVVAFPVYAGVMPSQDRADAPSLYLVDHKQEPLQGAGVDRLNDIAGVDGVWIFDCHGADSLRGDRANGIAPDPKRCQHPKVSARRI